MSAVQPREAGHLNLSGFEIAYAEFGEKHNPPVLLMPTWQIAPFRHWKMQIPHLSRSRRVIVFDPPGIGGGERTTDSRAFEVDRVIDYGIGVLNHLNIEQADVLGFSLGGGYALWLTARFPQRVNRLLLIAPVLPAWTLRDDPNFWEQRDSYEGWQKRNANYWRSHYDDWLEFFFGQACNTPFSTKIVEDLVSWAQETTPDILEKTVANSRLLPALSVDDVLERIACPVAIIHGASDKVAGVQNSQKLADQRPDFGLITMENSPHILHAREPVRTNLEIDAFLGPTKPARRSFTPAHARATPRALFISSPIGLGHVQRDLAIARELRRQVPDLKIDWLAQQPVTGVLEVVGEHIHPLSRQLASESSHWESSARDHRLNCFQAFRDMDEILLANFMVFLDAVRESSYDLWIGDEAWEVDHFLHENPELKTAPYIFMTDFVGWVPIDRSAGSRESYLTADYNQQMIEQVERYPYLRDRSLYFGSFDDLLPDRFGPGLPSISDWTHEHFDAVGYATPFNSADYVDREMLRARLGYDPDQPLVILTVGGTGVGKALLRKAIDAWPLVHRARPDARCVVVAGPRIDRNSLPQHESMEILGYVHNLYEHLAACDLAVVQGGLSTTMELTVNRRPFIYVPIQDHCEQIYHVTHRLNRYRAGHRLDYSEIDRETLAEAMLANLDADTSSYLAHVDGAADLTATRIAELL